MKRNYLFLMLFFLCLFACKESPKEHYTNLLKEWLGKEVRFPANPVFTIQGKDTVDFAMDADYKILTYVDSAGCISCKLQLDRWKGFMEEEDFTSVRFLFFLSPEKRRDILGTLKSNAFTHPVCIDETNELNRLNHFPTELGGQTFLLDKNNHIVAIGNPIHNPKIKELYLKIIQGEKPLVIQTVDTSCGCTKVEYSQEPVRPGGSITLRVVYKAEQPGAFGKNGDGALQCGGFTLAIDGERGGGLNEESSSMKN